LFTSCEKLSTSEDDPFLNNQNWVGEGKAGKAHVVLLIDAHASA